MNSRQQAGRRLAALIDVKTLVTFAVTGVFVFLVVTGQVASDVAMSVVFTVIAFYFGTQKQRAEDLQQRLPAGGQEEGNG